MRASPPARKRRAFSSLVHELPDDRPDFAIVVPIHEQKAAGADEELFQRGERLGEDVFQRQGRGIAEIAAETVQDDAGKKPRDERDGIPPQFFRKHRTFRRDLFAKQTMRPERFPDGFLRLGEGSDAFAGRLRRIVSRRGFSGEAEDFVERHGQGDFIVHEQHRSEVGRAQAARSETRLSIPAGLNRPRRSAKACHEASPFVCWLLFIDDQRSFQRFKSF